jgi:hypothetical protein
MVDLILDFLQPLFQIVGKVIEHRIRSKQSGDVVIRIYGERKSLPFLWKIHQQAPSENRY